MREMPIARTCVDIIAKPTTNAVTAPEGASLPDVAPFALRYKAMRNGMVGKVFQDMARGSAKCHTRSAGHFLTRHVHTLVSNVKSQVPTLDLPNDDNDTIGADALPRRPAPRGSLYCLVS